MWITRNKDNSIALWHNKPYKSLSEWKSKYEGTEYPFYLVEEIFPDLKWEDEPKEVFLNTGYDMANQINHVWAMLKCTQEELDKAHQTISYYKTKFDALDKIINDR